MVITSLNEVPEGVKWELGLAGFCPGKMGFNHWDWDLVTEIGEKGQKSKMEMGF